MPMFKVRVAYVDHIAHHADVMIEADTAEQALAQAEKDDNDGQIDFRETQLDCDPATYEIVPIPPTPEEMAMADMAHEYLGED